MAYYGGIQQAQQWRSHGGLIDQALYGGPAAPVMPASADTGDGLTGNLLEYSMVYGGLQGIHSLSQASWARNTSLGRVVRTGFFHAGNLGRPISADMRALGEGLRTSRTVVAATELGSKSSLLQGIMGRVGSVLASPTGKAVLKGLGWFARAAGVVVSGPVGWGIAAVSVAAMFLL